MSGRVRYLRDGVVESVHRPPGARRGRRFRRIVSAMSGHPFLVAGTDRLDTALMEIAGDRFFAKAGADGVHCACLPDRGLGIALKIEDGARRAADPALVEALAFLNVLTPEELEELSPFRTPVVRNTRREVVGSITTDLDLDLESVS